MHNEIPSPIPPSKMTSNLLDVKQEIKESDYDVKVKIENSMVVNDEIPMSISIPMEEIDKKEELDLDSIDMMQLPIQLDDGIDILADVKLVICFFILFS